MKINKILTIQMIGSTCEDWNRNLQNIWICYKKKKTLTAWIAKNMQKKPRYKHKNCYKLLWKWRQTSRLPNTKLRPFWKGPIGCMGKTFFAEKPLFLLSRNWIWPKWALNSKLKIITSFKNRWKSINAYFKYLHNSRNSNIYKIKT